MIKTAASYSSVSFPGDTILVILLWIQILSETGTNCRKERSSFTKDSYRRTGTKKYKQTDEEILENFNCIA